MNKIDKQYLQLVQDILDYGVEKKDRTGTGTKSIFGYTIRHKMSDGFPLLTTKKMAWKTMVTELLWFLRGDTNIKYLVDNGCNIWDGDAYKNYINNDTTVGKSIIYKNKTYKIKDQHNSNPNYVIIDDVNSSVVDLRWDNVLFDTQHIPQEEFINKIKTDDEFAKTWGDLGPVYGKQWRSWDIYENGITLYPKGPMSEPQKTKYIRQIDQIQNLINDLKTNPDSRRLMVSAWNVGELDQCVLPPCHYGFQVYTRELSLSERTEYKKKRDGIARTFAPYTHQMLDNSNIPTRAISLMWNQRSVDVGLGLPFNIASYGLLLEIIAKEVNMVPDELIGSLGDTHLYSNHIEPIKEQLTREPFDLPTLKHMKTDDFYKSLGEDLSLITHLESSDFQLQNYQSHPTIKLPLSN